MANVQNAKDYEAYGAAVAAFRKREGIEFFGSVASANEETVQEAYFSWRGCECCGSPQGEMCEDYTDGKNTYRICSDCVYYNEYGRLDDMTMLLVEMTA